MACKLFLAAVLIAEFVPGSYADTQVVMLGTGTPVPFPNRSGPSVAVAVDGKAYLFDFGPGVMRRAAAASPRFGGEIAALDISNLNIAFLTHLHSDHTAGLPDLLLTGWTAGKRAQPLKLYGPEGIDELVDGTHKAFLDDIKYRIYGFEPTNDQGWRVETTIVKEGVVYEDTSVRVIAFPVFHGTWPSAFGYRIETDDKVVVISGDLRPDKKIREYGKGADYLIHEVYCQAGFERWDDETKKYHASNHTSTTELAKLATEVTPKLLVVTHVLWFGCKPEEILEEIKAGYDGKVVIADDLDVYQ